MTSLSRQVGGREIADTKQDNGYSRINPSINPSICMIFRSNSDIQIPPRTLMMGTLNLQKKTPCKKG